MFIGSIFIGKYYLIYIYTKDSTHNTKLLLEIFNTFQVSLSSNKLLKYQRIQPISLQNELSRMGGVVSEGDVNGVLLQ